MTFHILSVTLFNSIEYRIQFHIVLCIQYGFLLLPQPSSNYLHDVFTG